MTQPSPSPITSWEASGTSPNLPTHYALTDASARQSALLGMYAALYAEMRDKDARIKDIVTWGVTGLTGSIFLGALTSDRTLTPEGAGLLTLAVILLCATLCLMVIHLAADRLSLARTLNRMHQAMGAFHDKTYLMEGALFPSQWIGWGHDPAKDAHWQQAILYIVLLVLIAVGAVLMIQGMEGTLALFVSQTPTGLDQSKR